MDIEKIFFPKSGELQTNKGVANATVVDVELDKYECTFNNDLCVEIDTKEFSHITLSMENLATLERLIIQAKEYYEDYFNENE